MTSPAALSAHGVILGTAAYMSPEQARGKPVDRRADIWAFGCVLFEMLTGRRAFTGETVTDVLAAIVDKEPAWSVLPAATPSAILRMLRRCLEKDVARRMPHAGAARIEIEDAIAHRLDATAGAEAGWRPGMRSPRLPWAIAAVAVVAALAAIAVAVNQASTPGGRLDATRLVLSLGAARLPLDRNEASPFAISPDGAVVAYVAAVSGEERARVYLRQLGAFEARQIPGTAGANALFFSPDSGWVAYFDDAGRLVKVPVAGGPPVVLAQGETMTTYYGGVWGPDGTIVWGSQTGLRRVPADGGPVESLTVLESGELSHRFPTFAPDGTLVFGVSVSDGASLWRVDLVSKRRSRFLEGADWTRILSSGHLLRVQAGNLTAAPFDPERMQTSGSATTVLDNVTNRRGVPLLAVSDTGTLVFLPGYEPSPLVWVDRTGRSTVAAAPSDRGDAEFPRLSPDGTKVATAVHGIPAPHDVWITDVERGGQIRMTPGDGNYRRAVWTPDGRRLVFGGRSRLAWVAADGSGTVEPLLDRQPREFTASSSQFPTSWSPDGRVLAFVNESSGTGSDIWLFPNGGPARPFLVTIFRESAAMFSPDGRWLAYVSNESGQDEVYVQPSAGGAKRLVSTAGGREPVWSRDGREIFFRAGGKLWAAAVTAAEAFSSGAPVALFTDTFRSSVDGLAYYDVAPDGSRFLMVGSDLPHGNELHVVLNWTAELKASVANAPAQR